MSSQRFHAFQGPRIHQMNHANSAKTSWREELDDGVSNNSDAFRVSVVTLSSLTLLHLSTCVELHRPTSCLLREREEWSVDNQTLCFRPRLTLIPRPHARKPCTFGFVFSSFRRHSEDHDRLQHCAFRDCARVPNRPKKSGLFVIVDLAAIKNSFQKSNNTARRFVSCVYFMWSFFMFHRNSSPHRALQRSSESIRHVAATRSSRMTDL